MRGHEMLIQLLLDGRKTPFIFINDYPCATEWSEYDETPTVCVHGDLLPTLDIRFVSGATVSISSQNKDRAMELFDMAIESGAKTVVSGHTVSKPHQVESWTGVWYG